MNMKAGFSQISTQGAGKVAYSPGARKPQPVPGASALLAALLPLTACLTAVDLGADPAPRPNIIFIMVDDMGYGDVGVYGQTLIQTPRLDAMAAEGIRFTDVYAGSPICAPARSVLMTGRHTGTTRIRGNFGRPGFGVQDSDGNWRIPLEPEDTTVAEVLQGVGYATGATGKWGLGEEGTTGIPNLQGFDEWWGMLNQRQAHSHYPAFMLRNTERVTLSGNSGTVQDFVTEAHYAQDLFMDFTIDFIEQQAAAPNPFFLYLPFILPHSRFQIPELEPYTVNTNWTMQEKVYASMITRLDRDVGRILDRLDSLAIGDNTLVFFCSDNGAADRYDSRFNSSGELRGRKRDVYDGGIRTVMIARWPDAIAAGGVSAAPWYFADVLPTLAELAGAAIPQGIDGISVVPALLGQPQPELESRPMYWEFHEEQFAQAIRIGNWKAVRQNPNEPTELYNLSTDPGESVNLASQHPDRIAQMENLFITLRTPSPIWITALDDAIAPGQLPPYLAGWLPLNESSGTTARDHAGLFGNAVLNGFSSPSWSSDASGRYLAFNGTDPHLIVSSQPPPAGAAPRTVATWVRTGSPGALFSWGDRSAAGGAWVTRIDTTTKALRVEVQGGAILGSTVLTNNQWHHVAAVFDTAQHGNAVGNIRLYVNGQLEPTTTTGTASQAITTTTGTPLRIGGETGRADLAFNGHLRHVQWFPVALSADAVAALADPTLSHPDRWHRTHFPNTPPDWTATAPGSAAPVIFHYATGRNPRLPLGQVFDFRMESMDRFILNAFRDPLANIQFTPQSSLSPGGPWLDAPSQFSAFDDPQFRLPMPANGIAESWRFDATPDDPPANGSPLFLRLKLQLTD